MARTATKTATLTRTQRQRLGELLLASGLITEGQLAYALDQQRRGAGRLGEVLIASGAVTEDALAAAVAAQDKRPFVPAERLRALSPPRALLDKLPRKFAERLAVLPLFERARTVWVASSEPESPERADAVRFALGCFSVRWMLVTPSALRSATAWAYAGR